MTKKWTMAGRDLRPGINRVKFEDASAGMMYRISLRYRRVGGDIAPREYGVSVQRAFYLMTDKGARGRLLKDGDVVPRGAYIESEVIAASKAGADLRYVLVDNPKPSCCEVLPADDIRYRPQSTQYVLREDKTATVLYHHEQTPYTIQDRCVLHAELAGEYVVAPACVELMYQTEVHGHSGTFHLTVKDEQLTADRTGGR